MGTGQQVSRHTGRAGARSNCPSSPPRQPLCLARGSRSPPSGRGKQFGPILHGLAPGQPVLPSGPLPLPGGWLMLKVDLMPHTVPEVKK